MLVFFALGNAKVLSFALGDAKLPNVNCFASQWNIGLRVKSPTAMQDRPYLCQYMWCPQVTLIRHRAGKARNNHVSKHKNIFIYAFMY